MRDGLMPARSARWRFRPHSSQGIIDVVPCSLCNLLQKPEDLNKNPLSCLSHWPHHYL